MSNRKSDKTQFDIILKKHIVIILILGIGIVILSLLINYNSFFTIFLIVDIAALVIVSAINIIKIIKNTIKL
ncbi:MAG: hypothetical protein N2B06_14295 [Clostridium sp.]